MKSILMVIAALLCFAPAIDLSASSSSSSSSWFNSAPNERPDRDRGVGTFKMIGRKGKSVVLSNNIIYEPTNKHAGKKTKKWLVNDTVRVLRSKKKNKYALVNMRSGDTIKVYLYDLK